MPVGSLLVIPLGEATPEEVALVVGKHFQHDQIAVLDRARLRRRPLHTLAQLATRRFDAAVLVASDLAQPRLRFTSPILLLARARSRWRIDLRGGRERWTAGTHVLREGWPVLRHLLACGLALTLGEPLLRALDRRVVPRNVRSMRRDTREHETPKRILYLRSQLWLGLAGGGSVAHTAGVIGGLTSLALKSTSYPPTTFRASTSLHESSQPEVWFDGWQRELEDLAYNVGLHVRSATRRPRLQARAHLPAAHRVQCLGRHPLARCAGAAGARVQQLGGVERALLGRAATRARAAQLVERINLRAADRVVVVSRVLRDELVARGVPAGRILVNPERRRPGCLPTRRRRTAHCASNSATIPIVVIGFSGTFGAWHGIPTLARALHAGPRGASERALAAARRRTSAAARERGPQGQHEPAIALRVPGCARTPRCRAILRRATCWSRRTGKQADGGEFFGSPTKLYEYMATGPADRRQRRRADRRGARRRRIGAAGAARRPRGTGARHRAAGRRQLPCARASGSAARAAAETRHTWRQNAERVLRCLDPWRPLKPEHEQSDGQPGGVSAKAGAAAPIAGRRRPLCAADGAGAGAPLAHPAQSRRALRRSPAARAAARRHPRRRSKPSSRASSSPRAPPRQAAGAHRRSTTRAQAERTRGAGRASAAARRRPARLGPDAARRAHRLAARLQDRLHLVARRSCRTTRTPCDWTSRATSRCPGS